MKKIISALFLLLCLGSVVSYTAVESQAKSTVLEQTTEESLTNEAASRSGYRWRCDSCGYTSEWHAFANTAVKRANEHMSKNPGHIAYTYRV
ncbi:hypothetical protein [Enterococcus termitis]|jgi:hypothetical protein|uniref:Uncharacterized protein n=1 Tax=Enterococcus termitis TaxID=332950 RepID=A0A1E5H4T8_9ENTE|nr:hypothetical protein [Enterococcus termitis]OEG19690.1 hypothetical protein BCR25_14670 [Enterococcus termitis]OJG97062.1 hypothetical protein RV18_GL001211 [Enterococcus termitis]